MEKISVAVRFRPPNPASTPAGPPSYSSSAFSGSAGACAGDRGWRIDDTRVSLLNRGFPVPAASFAFDHVFDGSATNARVYGAVVRAVIRAAVDGFNGTVFAYGQTSSGKTFTMNGSDDDPGIITLAVRDVFDTVCQAADREFLFRVSYMEIYNEDINDLLTLGSHRLQIKESLERGVYVDGLREDIVDSPEKVFDLLKLGEENRHFGETNMNVRSSRSHTIFRMVIESRAKNQMESGDAIRVSVLNLVDLAGSERIAKTGAVGVRLEEGKHINKSLMNLGIVINKLSESGKIGHIPYRDSKLTRILEPALGGNAKTSIICTAAPEEVHIEETKGTLQFASRAKCVSNCAQVNEILTDAAVIKRQKMEIEELHKRLQGSDSEAMKQVILKQSDDMHKLEIERDRLAMELEEERKLRETAEHRLAEVHKKQEDLNKSSSISADQFTDSTQLVALKALDSMYTPDGFVTRREHYSNGVEFSPIPEIPGNVADEDLWQRLNKGHNINFDILAMTPGLKSKPSLPEKTTSEAAIEARCQRLEKDCISDQQELQKERELLREENSSLLQELSRSKEELNRLITVNQELLKELNTRCPRLEKDCNYGAPQLDDLRARCTTLEEQLSRSKEEAGRLVAVNQELLNELNMRCSRLEKDCKFDPQQLEDLRARCATLEQELSRSKEEACLLFEDWRARCVVAEEELSRSKAEASLLIARKQEQFMDLRARCAAAEEELSRYKAEASLLAAEKRELTGEIAAERRKAEKLKPDIRLVNQTISQQEQHLTALLTKSKALLEQFKVS
ncbi:hypothetical protein ACP4OV_027171 [Aristida adscensionis]